ncbi:MAG: hypothetical protein H6742_21450 [Alphaproteobacteria bacterium]|nr:hypothetical protein [Alphaproteobacteria bacterium]
MSSGARPQVLLAVQDTRTRLRLLAALGAAFDAVPLAVDDDPVRAVRQQRPAIVLLEVPRGRSGNALRACRTIKTDAGTPPAVALVDVEGRLEEPLAAVEACMADGSLGTVEDEQAVRAFVHDVLAGRRPVVPAAARGGLLRRWLKR